MRAPHAPPPAARAQQASIIVDVACAAPEDFRRRVAAAMFRSRACASGSPTGRSTNKKLSRLPSIDRSDASRRLIGTSARSPRDGSPSPRESSNSPQAAGGRRQHHVGDRPAEVVPDRFELLQRRAHHGVPARLPDRHVQRGVGRAAKLVAHDQLGDLARALQRLPGMRRSVNRRAAGARAGVRGLSSGLGNV